MLARGANVDNNFKATFTKNVAVIWGGTNDAAAGISTAQSWSNLAAWSAARHAKGWETVIVTLLCGNPINPQIYANWPGTFDGLADVAADPSIGAAGACSNGQLFEPDEIHPLPSTTQTKIAPVIQTAILAR